MHTTTDVAELSLHELDLISGGADLVSGTLGTVQYASGTGGAGVTWPGSLDGVNGTWHMSTKTGLTWRPA